MCSTFRLSVDRSTAAGDGNRQYPRCTVVYNWVKLQRKIITYLITWDIGNVVLHSYIRRIESKYQAWNWLYFRNWINPCECSFPNKMTELVWMKEENISHYKVLDYFSLYCNFTQLYATMQRGYRFRFADRVLGYQRLPSPAAVLLATLKRKVVYFCW